MTTRSRVSVPCERDVHEIATKANSGSVKLVHRDRMGWFGLHADECEEQGRLVDAMLDAAEVVRCLHVVAEAGSAGSERFGARVRGGLHIDHAMVVVGVEAGLARHTELLVVPEQGDLAASALQQPLRPLVRAD